MMRGDLGGARRLLAVAGALCGSAVRHTVFEPLVADWQREWQDASSAALRVRCLLRGGAAFLLTLARCCLGVLFTAPSRAEAGRAWIAFAVATVATVVLLVALVGPAARWQWRGSVSPMGSPAVAFYFAVWQLLAVAAPLAVIPAILLLARSPRRTANALQIAGAGTLVTLMATGALEWRSRTPLPASLVAQHEQWVDAQDGAGRFTYPGSAVRALGGMNADARTARYLANADQLFARRLAQPVNWSNIVRPALLAAAAAWLGMALGRLRTFSPGGAAGWWCLTLLVFLSAGGVRMLSFYVWWPHLVLCGAALALSTAPQRIAPTDARR